MRKSLMFVVSIPVAAALLTSCAIAPRGSTWDSPPTRFTTAQVFNAALQAGGQNGMSTTSSDRESGTISFSKKIAKKTINIGVLIKESNSIVRVTTSAASDQITIAGLQEEIINNFHVFLFRNLNITNPAERNVRIEETH